MIGYECLTGHRPFSGESQIAIALAQVNDAPPPLPETLPKPVRALLMSMLAKDPKNRPANAIKLSEAAEAIRNGDISAAHAAVPGMLLFEAATGPITAPVNIATAPTGVIGGHKDSSADVHLRTAGARRRRGRCGRRHGCRRLRQPTPTALALAPRSTLSRADALAAERTGSRKRNTYDDEPADEPQRRGRSPWTWPLIALILLVLFALVGFFLTQQGILFPSGGSKTSGQTSASSSATSSSPSASSTSATPTPTRTTATPTPTPDARNREHHFRRPTWARTTARSSPRLGHDGPLGHGPSAAKSRRSAGTVLEINPPAPYRRGQHVTIIYAVRAARAATKAGLRSQGCRRSSPVGHSPASPPCQTAPPDSCRVCPPPASRSRRDTQ